MYRYLTLLLLFLLCTCVRAQKDACTLIRPDRVFDGEKFHEGKVVLVLNDKIAAVDAEQNIEVPAGCTTLRAVQVVLKGGVIVR